MTAVVHVQFSSDADAFAFGDYAHRQESVQAVSLTHPDSPAQALRQPRFVTDPINVTGNTPRELEVAAIAHAHQGTGWPAEQLAVTLEYRVHFTADAEAHHPASQTADQKLAVASGHPLFASIVVNGYGQAPEQETGDTR